MTAQELQDLIFNSRVEQGDVSLGLLPTLKQCEWLLFIDPEKDYINYTPEEALNDIVLYIDYQNKRRKPREYW